MGEIKWASDCIGKGPLVKLLKTAVRNLEYWGSSWNPFVFKPSITPLFIAMYKKTFLLKPLQHLQLQIVSFNLSQTFIDMFGFCAAQCQKDRKKNSKIFTVQFEVTLSSSR